MRTKTALRFQTFCLIHIFWLYPMAAQPSSVSRQPGVSPAPSGQGGDPLVAVWHFENDFRDSGSAGRHGRPLRGVGFGEGKLGRAASFNGTSSFLRVPHGPELNFGTGDFSLSLWVKFPIGGKSRWKGLLTKGLDEGLSGGGWALLADGTNGVLFRDTLRDGSVNASLGLSKISDGWHHIAVVRSSGHQYRIFLDGHADRATMSPGIAELNSTADLQMGKVGKKYAETQLDEVKFFRVALTEAELTAEIKAAESSKNKPQIRILSPAVEGTRAEPSVLIRWLDRDLDSDASIALYCDSDGSGLDGRLIVAGIHEDDETNAYQWEPRGLPPGEYYIYAIIEDADSEVASAYSKGTVLIGPPQKRRSFGRQKQAQAGSEVRHSPKPDLQPVPQKKQPSKQKRAHSPDPKKETPETSTTQSSVSAPSQPVGSVNSRPLDEPSTKIHSSNLNQTVSAGLVFHWAVFLADGQGGGNRRDIVWNGAGEAFTAGMESGAVVISRIDRAGKTVWTQRLKGSFEPAFGPSLALGPAESIVVAGSFQEQLTHGGHILSSRGGVDLFVVQFDTNGNMVWLRSAGGLEDDRAMAVAVDHRGHAVVTGSLAGSPTFGANRLTAKGDQDLFIAELDRDGAWLWVNHAGGENGRVQGYGIHWRLDGSLVVLGTAQGTVDFGAKKLVGDPQRSYRFMAGLGVASPP